jgi:hypothetical protein
MRCLEANGHHSSNIVFLDANSGLAIAQVLKDSYSTLKAARLAYKCIFERAHYWAYLAYH